MKQIIGISGHYKILVFSVALILVPPWLKAQKVAEQDSLALVAFYNATDGPNWISNQAGFSIDDLKDDVEVYYRANPGAGLNHWFDGPISKWFGVKLELQPTESGGDSVYRVVELWPVLGRRENGQNKLKGYVPREIGLLTALRMFKIEGNDGFNGTEIPDELYQKTLEQIHVEKCEFAGGISDAVKSCSNFKKFNLRYNNFYYIPSFDFMTEANLRIAGTQWIYSTNIAFEYIEPTIDYYYTLSPNIQEFGIEARDNTNVGVEREIVANLGTAVSIKITDAGSKGTVSWFKSGLNTFRTGENYVIASVQESDYADYFGRCENNYIKTYDLNGNYGPHDTKKIHLVKVPVIPVCTKAKTSYDGKSVLLYFTKPMAQPSASDIGSFTVDNGFGSISVEAVTLAGRENNRLTLQLSDAIVKGQEVRISYTPGNVLCANGGILNAFSDTLAFNFVHELPVLDTAITTVNGDAILVALDKFVDVNSFSTSDFIVKVNDVLNPVVHIVVSKGPVNNNISKALLLILTDPILTELDTVTLEYQKGKLKALYGGLLDSFAPTPVKNVVSSIRTEVILTFKDGTKKLENIFVNGDVSYIPTKMFDDGSHGDETAGDHTWSKLFNLADADYFWEVISRQVNAGYDTTITINEITGEITIILTPVIVNIDSSISGNTPLIFSISSGLVTGTTSFGIANKTITINLDMSNYSDYYQGEVSDVYIMGINNDWSIGLLMTPLGSNLFTITIEPYSVGDLIEFNFRNANVWENNTLLPRQYTVLDGDNILNLKFGDFTTSSGLTFMNEIEVYPNPSHGKVYISANLQIKNVSILNIIGQICQVVQYESEPDLLSIDVSQLNKGLYLLKITFSDGTLVMKRIIKD